MIDVFAEVPRVQLTQGVKLLDHTNQGMVLDGRWKASIKHYFGSRAVIAQQGDVIDATVDGTQADVKLLLKVSASGSYVWMSHREYLHAEIVNTVYPVYVAPDETAHLILLFNFQHALAARALDRHLNGKPVFCEATGKIEHGWSINVERLSDFLIPTQG